MDWIVAHPAAATAVATMALVVVGLLIGGGQIAVVWHGISTMRRSGERREREHERRHRETMNSMAEQRRESQERHREAMEAFAEQRRESKERHKEAMDSMAAERRESRERHRQAMESLAGQREALKALIERTEPRLAPGE